MTKKIKIGDTIIGKDSLNDPYLIAEIGVNHEGDLNQAKKMIKEVFLAGGDAVKFQAYKAETLASRDSPAYWDTNKEKTTSQFELFKKHDTFWKDEFIELAEYSAKYGIDFLVTPFDLESADFLDPLMPAYKIASADITNKSFLEHISKKGKPILLSTGASSISEIWHAIEWIKNKGNEQIVLLHCVLNYPTRYENANLGMIKDMGKIFSDYVIGYSDHTLPEKINDVMLTAWQLGAMVIEKHYTWNKELLGNDHYHAMNFNDLKDLVKTFNFNKKIMGEFHKSYLESEENARKYARRSIVAKRFISEGKIIEKDDLVCKRPGTGIPPWMISEVVGGIALYDIKEDEIMMCDKIRFKS